MIQQGQGKLGVLLVNLGTPSAPNASAVRTYLAEFLHDPRVVDVSRWIWCPVLHGIILRFRPAKVAKLYQSIWTEDGSPLLAISQRQQRALQIYFDEHQKDEIEVALAMTYGEPSLSSGFEQLKECYRIIVLPLYPQYSSATTASVFDHIAKLFKKKRYVPNVDMIYHYYQHPAYIDALVQSIRRYWEQEGKAEKLLLSFHGIPQRYANEGDPYPHHCQITSERVAQALGLSDDAWQLTYQSRFGREPWLQPYTDHTLQSLAESGCSQVQVICPGFSADCLETLEEIQEENKKVFLESGGKKFQYIPCLNDNKEHIHMMAQLIHEHR